MSHKDQEIRSSLPRAGKRLAARLLAEWGDDRARYADATSVQTLAGTAPVPFQSGNYAKAHKRFACVKTLRNDLHQFAWQSTLSEPWARAYDQRTRSEGKTHRMAMRSLANLWVRIISRMWMSETASHAETVEAAQLAWAGICATTHAHRLQGKLAEHYGLTSRNGVGGFLMLHWPFQTFGFFIASFSLFPCCAFRT